MLARLEAGNMLALVLERQCELLQGRVHAVGERRQLRGRLAAQGSAQPLEKPRVAEGGASPPMNSEAPLCARQRRSCSGSEISPFAITGMETARTTSPMASQSARPE